MSSYKLLDTVLRANASDMVLALARKFNRVAVLVRSVGAHCAQMVWTYIISLGKV